MAFLKSFLAAWRAPRRLPLLRSDAAGAAHACLAMLATRFGQAPPDAPAAAAGLADMMRALGAAGLACRLRSLARASIDALRLPCILSWDGPDYVVLAALGDGWATLHDPVHGRLRLPLAILRQRSRGAALECIAQGRSAPPARATPSRGMSLPRLACLRLLGLAVAAECLVLTAPALLHVLVERMLVGGDYAWLPLLALAAGLLLPLYGTLRAMHATALQSLVASTTYARQLRRWRRGGSEAPLVRMAAALDTIACLPACILLGALQPRLLVLVCGVLGWAILLRRAQARAAKSCAAPPCDTRQAALMARFGLAAAARRQRQANATAALAATLARTRNAAAVKIRHAALAGWLAASLLMIVGAQAQSGQLSAGAALALAMLAAWLAWRGARLLEAWMPAAPLSGVQEEACAHIGRPRMRAQTAEAFEAQGLGFRYPATPAFSLQGLDLRIGAGETVLLCGPGASGKTTLCRLLAGELAPDAGRLLWPPAPARVAVLAVYADDRLQAGTIAQNLCLFEPLPANARIDACLRLAGAHAAVMALQAGYETNVEEGGAPLPQSLRQRLLVARALYARPAVLLLDEATSALAAEEERDLLAALAAAGMAVLVVSRRLEARREQDLPPMRRLRLSA